MCTVVGSLNVSKMLSERTPVQLPILLQHLQVR